MKIVDKNGLWLVSDAAFPLVDPTNGTRFEPGEKVKAAHTAWVLAQPTIKRCGDPSSELSKKEQDKLDADNAADAAARDNGQLRAEQAQARARGELVDLVQGEALQVAPVEQKAED